MWNSPVLILAQSRKSWHRGCARWVWHLAVQHARPYKRASLNSAFAGVRSLTENSGRANPHSSCFFDRCNKLLHAPIRDAESPNRTRWCGFADWDLLASQAECSCAPGYRRTLAPPDVQCEYRLHTSCGAEMT